jgi:hypothetical protein
MENINDIYYPSCDWCKCEIVDQVYSIPLDPEWRRISGNYCSKIHALKDNAYFNRDRRTVEGWEEREKWFLMKEEGEEEGRKKKMY